MMVWPENAVPDTVMTKALKAIARKRTVRVEQLIRSFGANVSLTEVIQSAYLQGLADGSDIANRNSNT